MSEFNIAIPSGESKRLLTGGKYCPEDILVTAEAKVEVVSKDVDFYDYDGTLLYSYTLEEIQALTELPPNPTHEGLTAQGWNWTLADLKEYGKPMDVGAHYITDDGKTRLYIRLVSEERLSVPLCFSQSAAHGVTVNWGDGSAEETHETKWGCTLIHDYPSVGEYMITLTVTSGYVDLGYGYHYYSVIGGSNNTGAGGNTDKHYKNRLIKVEIGSGVNQINGRAFISCAGLQTVTVPAGLRLNGTANFCDCYSLKFVVCQTAATSSTQVFTNCASLKGVSLAKDAYVGGEWFCYCYSLRRVRVCHAADSAGWGTYAFRNCHVLEYVEFPETQTTIKPYSNQNNHKLTKVTIPASVAAIDEQAFGTCYGLAEVHLLPTTPPTMSNVSTFNGALTSQCVFYVPKGCLEAYQTATNWTEYASLMREE